MEILQSVGFIFMYLGLVMFTWPTWNEHQLFCQITGWASSLSGITIFLLGTPR